MLVKYVYWYVFACVCIYTVKWWGCTVWLTCVSVLLGVFSLCQTSLLVTAAQLPLFGNTVHKDRRINSRWGRTAGPHIHPAGWPSNHWLQMEKIPLLLTWIHLPKSSTNTEFVQFGRRQHKKKKKLQLLLLLLLERIVTFPQWRVIILDLCRAAP